eukprot:1002678-Pyramimonas_sp.AAC.1
MSMGHGSVRRGAFILLLTPRLSRAFLAGARARASPPVSLRPSPRSSRWASRCMVGARFSRA